jgi:endonuclease/exonuclease/phosphatase family metal-dependent hydrolase
MKTRAFSFLSAVAVLLIVLSGCSDKPATLKVLYWNIQNGMWADQGNDYDNFVDFVVSQNPDICVWAEAESRYRTDTSVKMAGCEEAYLPYNWDLLARRYGHQYVCIAGKRDTFPQVVTSKYPLKIVKRINGNGEDIVVVHGAGHVEVDVNGEKINIVTVHTYPFKYTYLAEDQKASAAENGGDVFRAAEMKFICEQTILEQDPQGKENWMMVGDFNAVSRVDNWHLGRPEDDKAFLLNDYVRSQTPYIDLIEKWYPGEYQKSTFSGRRIDFVYLTQPLFSKVTDARTIHDGYATTHRDSRKGINFCHPSDHYPIVFTIKL